MLISDTGRDRNPYSGQQRRDVADAYKKRKERAVDRERRSDKNMNRTIKAAIFSVDDGAEFGWGFNSPLNLVLRGGFGCESRDVYPEIVLDDGTETTGISVLKGEWMAYLRRLRRKLNHGEELFSLLSRDMKRGGRNAERASWLYNQLSYRWYDSANYQCDEEAIPHTPAAARRDGWRAYGDAIRISYTELPDTMPEGVREAVTVLSPKEAAALGK